MLPRWLAVSPWVTGTSHRQRRLLWGFKVSTSQLPDDLCGCTRKFSLSAARPKRTRLESRLSFLTWSSGSGSDTSVPRRGALHTPFTKRLSGGILRMNIFFLHSPPFKWLNSQQVNYIVCILNERFRIIHHSLLPDHRVGIFGQLLGNKKNTFKKSGWGIVRRGMIEETLQKVKWSSPREQSVHFHFIIAFHLKASFL